MIRYAEAKVTNLVKFQFYVKHYHKHNWQRLKYLLGMTTHVAGRMLAIRIRCASVLLTKHIYAIHNVTDDENKFQCMLCSSHTETETIEHIFHDCSLYSEARFEYYHSIAHPIPLEKSK